jgi:hypothetical protein
MESFAMATERMIIQGIVKDGVIIPEGEVPLPEGMQVGILLLSEAFPAELRTELEAWDRAGEEAWNLINEWEEEGIGPAQESSS